VVVGPPGRSRRGKAERRQGRKLEPDEAKAKPSFRCAVVRRLMRKRPSSGCAEWQSRTKGPSAARNVENQATRKDRFQGLFEPRSAPSGAPDGYELTRDAVEHGANRRRFGDRSHCDVAPLPEEMVERGRPSLGRSISMTCRDSAVGAALAETALAQLRWRPAGQWRAGARGGSGRCGPGLSLAPRRAGKPAGRSTDRRTNPPSALLSR